MYVIDWLHRQAQHQPGKTALIDIATGRQWTYRQFDERASRFAELARERWRLEPGDRVAVLASNSTDYFELLYGCAKAGLIMVCLNWRLPAAELAPILADCTPRALVTSAELTESAEALCKHRPTMHRLRIADPHEPRPGTAAARRSGWPDYEAELEAGSGRIVEMPNRSMNAPWYLLYTSGTTGKPKGVIQTYGMMFFNAVNSMLATQLSRDDVLLAALPFFHTGGLNLYANPILHAGGTVVVMKQFDAGIAIACLDGRHGPPITQFLGVPALYLFISQHPSFANARFARMRHWSAGGSPMPRALLDAWAARGVTICFGFGMTETGPTVFVPDVATARAKPGSVGKPVGSMLTRVVDADGRDCPPNRPGELLIKGPGVTPGYWNLPEVTESTIVDGWLHTGDVALVDDDGDYWIVDRLKDMYISGGENVYPAEVENVLYAMPGVAEAAIVGVPDERWVETGLAVVVMKPGAARDADAVRAWCRERLAGYKVPRHVRFVDLLPRTPAGKVEKPRLRAEFDAAQVR